MPAWAILRTRWLSLRHVIVLFSALSMMTSSALSASAAHTLEMALRKVPESALASSDPIPVVFLDVRAVSNVEGGASSDAAVHRMVFSQSIRPLGALQSGGARTWTEKAGIALKDIAYFAAFGQLPTRVTCWGFDDPAASEKLLDKLQTLTFRQVSASPRILANGEPRAMNLKERQPDNPWSGPLGETSAVMAMDAAILQASAAEGLEQLVSLTRSVAENAAVAVALTGLTTLDAGDHGGILQAAVFTPVIGMPLLDPAAFVARPDLGSVTKAIESRLEGSQDGIPAYAGGILADYQSSDAPALVVSLAYPDCAMADTAVSALKTRWQAGMPPVASIEGRSVTSPGGGCAAVVRFNQSTGSKAAIGQFLTDYTRRGFNLLQIGSAR
ncbi:hypothetical protein SAMN02799642_05007 [Methylobacterium brachiatum]|nr:hypothetical protein SAMN02799642_05007 [Methylobacterium brachiatum]